MKTNNIDDIILSSEIYNQLMSPIYEAIENITIQIDLLEQFNPDSNEHIMNKYYSSWVDDILNDYYDFQNQYLKSINGLPTPIETDALHELAIKEIKLKGL